MEELELALDLAFEKLSGVTGYKLKHRPSGLYFRPTNGFKSAVEKKPSLSKIGKTYKKRPRIPEGFRDVDGVWKSTSKYEWEIEWITKK